MLYNTCSSFLLSKHFIKLLVYSNGFTRAKSILIVAEHNNKTLTPITLNAVEAAKKIGGELTVLVAGTECHNVAKMLSNLHGLRRVLVAEDDAFAGFPAENLTPLILATQKRYRFNYIMAGATNFGRSVLPRVAAKLDVPVITDITDVKSPDTFVRPIYAGSALMTLKSNDPIKVLTVAETCCGAASIQDHRKLYSTIDTVTKAMNLCKVQHDKPSKLKMIQYLRLKRAVDSISHWKIETENKVPIEQLCIENCNPGLTTLLARDSTKCRRYRLSKAKVIICGGRGMKSAENFQMLYDLARKLHGEVGASRTAVEEGYAPNDLMIGQMGAIVSPNLYIGVGVSGEPQHIAGIKNSKTIFAINRNPLAPIFEVANYALIADLFKTVPELIAKLK